MPKETKGAPSGQCAAEIIDEVIDVAGAGHKDPLQYLDREGKAHRREDKRTYGAQTLPRGGPQKAEGEEPEEISADMVEKRPDPPPGFLCCGGEGKKLHGI